MSHLNFTLSGCSFRESHRTREKNHNMIYIISIRNDSNALGITNLLKFRLDLRRHKEYNPQQIKAKDLTSLPETITPNILIIFNLFCFLNKNYNSVYTEKFLEQINRVRFKIFLIFEWK